MSSQGQLFSHSSGVSFRYTMAEILHLWSPAGTQTAFLDIPKEITLTLTSASDELKIITGVVFVDRIGVFLEHVHRTLKASEWFMSNFFVVSLYIARLLALRVQAPQLLQHSLKICIDHRPAGFEISRHDKTSGSARTVVFILRTNIEAFDAEGTDCYSHYH